ncbi:MAG TPA: hypothetical protein VMT87_15730 [Vicinamibacteria bacterium]|nr:hypothetical protein [Vicinamibacteria bacterium]
MKPSPHRAIENGDTGVWFMIGMLPADHEEITTALVSLVQAGFTVTVTSPPGLTEHLGWRVLLDRPGRHTSFRMRVGAGPAEWAAAVGSALRYH